MKIIHHKIKSTFWMLLCVFYSFCCSVVVWIFGSKMPSIYIDTCMLGICVWTIEYDTQLIRCMHSTYHLSEIGRWRTFLCVCCCLFVSSRKHTHIGIRRACCLFNQLHSHINHKQDSNKEMICVNPTTTINENVSLLVSDFLALSHCQYALVLEFRLIFHFFCTHTHAHTNVPDL